MTNHRPAIILLFVLCLIVPASQGLMASEDEGAGAGSAPAPSEPVSPHPPLPVSSPHPPKNLKFIDGHWTPYDPPKVPEGAQAYIIVPGDTLWDLSEKFLKDPWLWPQLWDNNRYILDSHWIYPGDPILVPAPPTVVPPAPPEAAEGPPIEEEEQQPETETASAAPPLPQPYALADTQDLYCSGYIDEDYQKPGMRIAGLDEKGRISQAQGDIVYLNRGTNDGVTVGSEYDVIHPALKVENPETGKPLGTLVARLGRVHIIAVQPSTATAEIVFSCIEMKRDDRLVQKWDPTELVGFNPPAMDRYGTQPSGKADGLVVAGPDELLAVGQGHVVQIDLGSQSGLKPGDRINIFRDNEMGPDYARKLLGTGLVLTVRESTSAVKVTESAREILIGDRVEIR